jgi:hypothetical protein
MISANWGDLTALCALVSLIGIFGLFMVRAIMREGFADIMREIRQEFATKDRVGIVEARITGLEQRFDDSMVRRS